MEHPPIASTHSWLGVDLSRSTLRRLGPRRSAWLIASFVLLFVALRCVHLDADPPRSFGSRAARELVSEPAAKSHEARNYALFDSFHVNEADDYQFWRAQSPVWVYPLTGFFQAFGTDWPQLRAYSTLYAALGLAGLLLIAVRFASPWAVCFIGGLLACDVVYFHYARAGLIEPAVSSWITGCMLALILAERRPAWLIVAHWAFVLAFFTKQAALIALPASMLASVWVLWPLRTDPGARRVKLAVMGNALLLCVLAAIYVLNSDYWRAVTHNVNHVLLGSDAPNPYKYRGFGSIFSRIFADGRYQHFLMTVPVSGTLALLALAALARQLLRQRRIPYAPMVLAGWFACAFGAMLAVAWSALRFWQVVVAPAALMAGLALDALYVALHARGRAQAFKPVAIGAALVLFAVHAFMLREPLFQPKFTLRDGAQAVVRTIGPRDATVVGARSPGLLLGTPYKNYYVRAQFNATREQLQRLAITHYLFRQNGDGSRNIVTRALPGLMETLVPVLSLEVRGEKLELFAADQHTGPSE